MVEVQDTPFRAIPSGVSYMYVSTLRKKSHRLVHWYTQWETIEADDILRSCNLLSEEDQTKYIYRGYRDELEAHFNLRRNRVIFERARFNNRRQEQGESVLRCIYHCMHSKA